MKATEEKLLDFLRKSPQFVIPIYQRNYAWTRHECDQLWSDILRAGKDDSISAHFVGSIVYIEQGIYQVATQSQLLVIDGQQRLTTIMLILEALARQLGDSEPVKGFSARKLRNYYLLNPDEDGEDRFKLLLTQTDRTSLLALIEQEALPIEPSLRVTENFKRFQDQLKEIGSNLSALCNGLSKLIIVDISLNRDQDNPQLIFESMNSTGRALGQADLIRNFILMGLESNHQIRLYESTWRPMELEFGQEAYGTHFDSFMRHYLTLKTGDIPNVRAVYEAFKSYAARPEVMSGGIDALVEDIRTFAGYYCAMALDRESNRLLSSAFRDLRELTVNVAYPFLLELYNDYAIGALSALDFEQAIRLVEAYVFRRAVCDIPTNSLNKTFVTFGRELRKDRYLESIQAHLMSLPSYRRFPKDEEFRRSLIERDLYNFPRRSYWLRRFENHDRKEHVPVNEYTIEHILPQNPNLSDKWREALGPNWMEVRDKWLHTLGNLTLTAYNAEYSDRPFSDKRDMEGGFGESPLILNKGLGSLDNWDENTIKSRADILAKTATKVWAAPCLEVHALDTHRSSPTTLTGYIIEDHPYLDTGTLMRSLFEALRQELLGLDECVTEEFLKLYVAYKAETNFVDVVPQAGRLRLSLNMKFHELHDSLGLAKDVTNVGRWGNGDVEVALSSTSELPYVMGLIRQAFEKQMGNGDIGE